MINDQHTVHEGAKLRAVRRGRPKGPELAVFTVAIPLDEAAALRELSRTTGKTIVSLVREGLRRVGARPRIQRERQ